jgi:hypothetical protein
METRKVLPKPGTKCDFSTHAHDRATQYANTACVLGAWYVSVCSVRSPSPLFIAAKKEKLKILLCPAIALSALSHQILENSITTYTNRSCPETWRHYSAGKGIRPVSEFCLQRWKLADLQWIRRSHFWETPPALWNFPGES